MDPLLHRKQIQTALTPNNNPMFNVSQLQPGSPGPKCAEASKMQGPEQRGLELSKKRGINMCGCMYRCNPKLKTDKQRILDNIT